VVTYARRLVLSLSAVLTLLVATCASASALIVPDDDTAAADGSFIQVTGNAAFYEVIGGAAIHVYDCSELNGCPNLQQVPDLAPYAAVPANGSFIQIQDDDGYVGEFVGGAVLHVDSCTDLNDCQGGLDLDLPGANAYMAGHPLPSDGTLIRSVDTGAIGEVIGGAVVHINDCSPFNGCADDANVTNGMLSSYESANPTPADGTFVQVANGSDQGLIARVAGGALLTIGDCASIGGCPATIDQLGSGDFSAYSGANPVPSDGTYLLGLPSNTYWEVLGGEREQVTSNSAAVPVDDSSLNVIPVASAGSSGGGTSGSGTPTTVTVAPTTTSPTTTTRPTGTKHKKTPPAVSLKFIIVFRYVKTTSQLTSIRSPALKRPDQVTLSCTGRGCPFRTDPWKRGTARAYLRSLEGTIYHAGDRLVLAVSHPGDTTERIGLTIRDGRVPTGS
jgi:hypothetical protein